MIELSSDQISAIQRMRNGCILCGGTGAGKSRTALGYFYVQMGGTLHEGLNKTKLDSKRDLYIITTAKKRDTEEWEHDFEPFHMKCNLIVDSWNNISKYVKVSNAFFIFDEQRVVGTGKWSKSFIRIAKMNRWILLSATPGDTWKDYMSVFIANGFYRNATDFKEQHMIITRYGGFPQLKGYMNEKKLRKIRDLILVHMDYIPATESHDKYITCSYDVAGYKLMTKTRWDPIKNDLIATASVLCYAQRRIVNSSEDRLLKCFKIALQYDKVIIFYNFDFELEMLRNLDWASHGYSVGECNGHKHDGIPKSKKWIYLVNYAAGAEGWNCIETNVMIFYSLHYSYKIMRQAKGRIERRNTPFKDLYYYYLTSTSSIDKSIKSALDRKREFNATRYYNQHYKRKEGNHDKRLPEVTQYSGK